MPRSREITCACGFVATDGHWPNGQCPDCKRASTLSGTRWIRVGENGTDPVAWLRTGWMAAENGKNENRGGEKTDTL